MTPIRICVHSFLFRFHLSLQNSIGVRFAVVVCSRGGRRRSRRCLVHSCNINALINTRIRLHSRCVRRRQSVYTQSHPVRPATVDGRQSMYLQFANKCSRYLLCVMLAVCLAMRRAHDVTPFSFRAFRKCVYKFPKLFDFYVDGERFFHPRHMCFYCVFCAMNCMHLRTLHKLFSIC